MRSAPVLAIVALVLTGCPDGKGQAPAPDVGAAKDPAAFQREAHKRALAVMLPLAQQAFTLADSLAVAQSGRAAPAAPGVGAGFWAEARKLTQVAWREAEQIKADRLDPRDAIVLRTVNFGLLRLRDQSGPGNPTWTDLGWYLGHVTAYVDELEYRVPRGQCDECAKGLVALGPAVRAAASQLSATSLSSLEAAREDLGSIRAKIQRIPRLAATPDPALDSAAREAIAGIDAVLGETDAWVSALTDQTPVAWTVAAKPPGREPVKRLEDRIGAKVLERRLEIEEGVSGTPRALFEQAGATLARLDAMAKAQASQVEPPAKPGALDEARCKAARSQISTWAERQPGIDTKSLRCDALVREALDRRVDDPDLLRWVVQRGVVAPTQRQRRAEELPAIALVSGTIAPASHTHAMTIAVLAGIADGPALARAIADARDDVCLAATALWVHGELGSDDEIEERLTKRCGQRRPHDWIVTALARPRRALEGAGLGLIGAGPADAVGLDRFWWAPLGLIPMLATPPGAAAQQEAPARVKLEPLQPTKTDP